MRMGTKEILLDEIDSEVQATARWTGRHKLGERVRAALAKVPRESFVPPAEELLAYFNVPLPIGHGQTISQPYIVAIMTELLDLTPESVVLEIGTGSGYQAAVLAEIARKVYSIEVVPELAQTARQNLDRCGYTEVEVRTGDGNLGWPEHAPFDAIIVTAAASATPPALIEQLRPGGRMIIPLRDPQGGQTLALIRKARDGKIRTKNVLPVAFVPLVSRKATREPGV